MKKPFWAFVLFCGVVVGGSKAAYAQEHYSSSEVILTLNAPLVDGVHTVYKGQTISGNATTSIIGGGEEVEAPITVSTNHGQSTNGTGNVNFSFTATTSGTTTIIAHGEGISPEDTVYDTVNVISLDFSISSDKDTVAAGGLGSSEHSTPVTVTVTNHDTHAPISGYTVPTPTMENDTGVNTDASLSTSNSTSDSNGMVHYTFTSSDVVGNVTLKEDGGESPVSASIGQDWTNLSNTEGDQITDSWMYDDYFDYDTPSTITFRMALDSNGTIPITGHDIHFVTTELDGWEWDPNAGEDFDGDGYLDGDYVAKSYSGDGIDNAGYGDLSVFGSTSETLQGSYSSSQTINSNINFWVDNVSFDAVDWNVFQ